MSESRMTRMRKGMEDVRVKEGKNGEWKGGRMEEKKKGRVEEGKGGRGEGWKRGRVEGWKLKEAQSRMNVAEYAFGILH